MKSLHVYLECNGMSTPANTMGMGDPGQISPDTLTEPIATAKCDSADNEVRKKKKKKKFKSIVESLFSKDLISSEPKVKPIYKEVSFSTHVKTMFNIFFVDSLVKGNDYEDNVRKIFEDMPLPFLSSESMMLEYLKPYLKPTPSNTKMSIYEYKIDYPKGLLLRLVHNSKDKTGNRWIGGAAIEVTLKLNKKR